MGVDAIIDGILEEEGGYVDHENDAAGPTNFGITQATLRWWRGHEVSTEEVRNLTQAEARNIYEHQYVYGPNIHRLPMHLQSLMVDSAVQHGADRAIKWLQEAAGTVVDGIIGPNTLDEVNNSNIEGLYRQVLGKRIRFYFSIIHDDPSQAVFANGWGNRVTKFITNSNPQV